MTKMFLKCIFKGLSLKQIKQNFLEGESPTLRKECIVRQAMKIIRTCNTLTMLVTFKQNDRIQILLNRSFL